MGMEKLKSPKKYGRLSAETLYFKRRVAACADDSAERRGVVIEFLLFAQFTATFFGESDLMDKTVKFIPREPTLYNYSFVIRYTDYWMSFLRTFLICLMCVVIQTFICSSVGYGFAKFRFKGRGLLFAAVIFTIVIPPQTIMLPLFMKFRYFDVFGILQAVFGVTIKTVDTIVPLLMLSLTGLAFRCGLFIFLMRQFYRGTPDELNEAAYVDGAGVYRTFFSIIFPLGRSLMITIFIYAFVWQWTDTFYSGLFFSNMKVLSSMVADVTLIPSLQVSGGSALSGLMVNTATMLILFPLLVVYLCTQRLMIEGIERSGITG